MEMPIFPLTAIVLPEGRMPLRLFEPKYINMVKNCFKTDTGFGICLIKNRNAIAHMPMPFPQGTHVKLVDFDQGDDGLLHIVVEGMQEFNLLSCEPNEDELLIGDVSFIEHSELNVMPESFEELATKLETILDYVEPNLQYPEKHLDNPTWVCNRLLELLPISPTSKFELLQLPSADARLNALLNMQFELED